MTRKERAVLRQAAEIITREIKAGRDVRIPRFGKFTTSHVVFVRVHPDDQELMWDKPGIVRQRRRVLFSTFGALRELFPTRVGCGHPHEALPLETEAQSKAPKRRDHYPMHEWWEL